MRPLCDQNDHSLRENLLDQTPPIARGPEPAGPPAIGGVWSYLSQQEKRCSGHVEEKHRRRNTIPTSRDGSEGNETSSARYEYHRRTSLSN